MSEGVRAVTEWSPADMVGHLVGMRARASCVTCDMCVQHVCVYVERASHMCVCMHTCGQAGMSPVHASVRTGVRAYGTQAGVHV